MEKEKYILINYHLKQKGDFNIKILLNIISI